MAANNFKSPPPIPPFQYSTPGASEQTARPATETAPPCSPARQLPSSEPYSRWPKTPAATAPKVSQFGIKPVLRSQNAANAQTTTVTSRNVITARLLFGLSYWIVPLTPSTAPACWVILPFTEVP